MVHLIKMALTYLKTNAGARNRHPSREKSPSIRARSSRHSELPRQHRKLENENRSSGGDDGEKRLRETNCEDCGGHVHSPLTELIERYTACSPHERATNAVSDRLLSET
jgi:hypothetical protein